MQALPFFEYSLYEMFLMICFWSFVGWVIEVVDMTLETGEYQNRGFLNMPLCPIHGVGFLMVIVITRPIENTLLPLFLTAMGICTGFELFMGWGMEKLFNARWWDYSHMKFNFRGYICLRNSLFFGFACVFAIRVVQPMVEEAIDAIPPKIGMVIVIVMAVLLIIDTTASIIAALRFNKKIKRLDEISQLLFMGSTVMGNKLADGALMVKSGYDKIKTVKDNVVEKGSDKIKTVKENVVEKSTANIEMLKAEYEKLVSEKDSATERIVKAFPNMNSIRYSRGLQILKDRINRKTKNESDGLKISVESDKIEE